MQIRQKLLSLKGHKGKVCSIFYSPDGSRIATTGWIEGTSARIWDSRTGEELLALAGHSMGVCATAFSPDGRRVVTGSFDRTARIWDTRSGRQLLVLKSH